MKLGRVVLVSLTPCLSWAFVVGCGSGGGYRGVPMTGGSSGTAAAGLSGAGASGAGAGGAGAGGMDADAGGFSGAGGSAQGSEGGAPPAGAGGSTISGGQAGSAGAGMGGLAGVASVAGAAGDSVAGSAGIATGGSGAMSGAGGTSGSAGSGGAGVAGGFGGFGGTNGSGGAAGASGPLRTCGERCNTHSDCRIFGVDQGYVCNATTHRCERFADPCKNAVECIPDASFWIFACRTDSDCFFFSDDVCVDVGGVGRCARLAPSANGCMDPNPDEVMLPRFNVSGSALVCANASRTCDGGKCVPGCRTSADCTPARNGSVCDTQTRLCRCVRDADCGGAGVSRCNTATGSCECSDSRECGEVPNSDACLSGRCGCSGVSACNVERTFSSTTYVCE